MTAVEEVRTIVRKAEGELVYAKDMLNGFNAGSDGKWLEQLKIRLRSEEGTAQQRAEWEKEKDKLEDRLVKLEDEKARWGHLVVHWTFRLSTAIDKQTGND